MFTIRLTKKKKKKKNGETLEIFSHCFELFFITIWKLQCPHYAEYKEYNNKQEMLSMQQYVKPYCGGTLSLIILLALWQYDGWLSRIQLNQCMFLLSMFRIFIPTVGRYHLVQMSVFSIVSLVHNLSLKLNVSVLQA